MEIVNLIVGNGDPSKFDRSRMTTGPELTVIDLDVTALQGGNKDVISESPAGYEIIDRWESPRVISTHMHERHMPPDVWNKKVKVVYLGRNPKDVFCSAAAFSFQMRPPHLCDFDNFIKECLLYEGRLMGSWFDHVLGYEKRLNNDNFLFVKYEDLQKDLPSEVRKIATFLGRPLSDEIADKVVHYSTMSEMRKTYDRYEEENPDGYKQTRAFGKVKFLSKGKVGNWKDKITGDLNALFDEVYEEKMAGSQIKFEFEI